MSSSWLTGSSGHSTGEGTSSELCDPAVLPASLDNVRVLAQGTSTGPCFEVEELGVYTYKMNSKNDFLI